ncbi:WEB family protein At5g16730, chloroplastic-like [Helianthus annuus]|uniref:WEB family protein At5g16730, chloroplastic-like n=1 Tax=Helianthus annuus TaxID=4232 RepID=UPI000B8F5E4F|nr:WEB family protein At5g16730, chloroplastic-like [Helianthus annuus]
MHKEQKSFAAAQKKFSSDERHLAQLMAKLKDDQAKFEAERKTEEWSVAGWKRKAEAEAALLSEERKNWRKICEKDNAEKANLRIIINNLKADVEKLKNQDAEVERLKKEKVDLEALLAEARAHRERSEQREVQALSTLAIRNKELEELTALVSDQEQLKKDLDLARSEHAESSRRLTVTEEKLENSETARVSAESELEPLRNDMTWLKDRGIACVAESVLNSKELDKTVADLVVAAQRDGYAQGNPRCLSRIGSSPERILTRFVDLCIDGESIEELIERYVELYWIMVSLKITKTKEEWVNKLENALPGDEWRMYLSDWKTRYLEVSLGEFIDKIKERELELQKIRSEATDEAKCKSDENVREVEEQVKEISAIKLEKKAEDVKMTEKCSRCDKFESDNVKLLNTAAALASMKAEFNNLQLPVMELIDVALQSDDPVTQLKEIFPDEEEVLE